MGLLQLSGQGFVGDVQQLIFAPYKAYQQELSDWQKTVDDFLSNRIFKGANASAPPALDLVVNAINVGIRGKALSPPPVFEGYHTEDSYTLAQQRGSEEKGTVTAGINVPTAAGITGNLGLNASVDATQKDTAQEVHKVTCDVKTADFPVSDPGDVYTSAAQLWMLAKFATPLPAPAKA